MASLFAAVRWESDPSPLPGDALDELLAHHPWAPWHIEERHVDGSLALAVIYPGGGSLATASLGGGDEWMVAAVAAGDARSVVASALGRSDGGPDPAHATLRWGDGRLTLRTDLVGSHPLYLRRRPGSVLVSTSALVLALARPVCGLDPVALTQLITFGQVLGRRTIFEGVEAVPAAATACVTRDAIDVSRRGLGDTIGSPATTASVRDALTDAVAALSPADRVGLLLSGGLDSRLLLTLARDGGFPVEAFTFGERHSVDMIIATEVAGRAGIAHHRAPSTPEAFDAVLAHSVALTDGMVSSLYMPGVELLPTLREVADVQWNGFAGDAILGGTFVHPRYLGRSRPATLDVLHRAFARGIPASDMSEVLDPDLASALAEAPRQTFEEAVAGTNSRARGARLAFEVLMSERVGRLAGAGLALDRHYLPVITPYAHGAVIDQMRRMRMGDRRFSRLLRSAMREASPELARVEWQRAGAPADASTATLVGALLVRRLRQRWGRARTAHLVDYGGWLRGPLAPTRRRALMSLAGHPMFNAVALRRRANEAPVTAADVMVDGILITLAVLDAILAGRVTPDPLVDGPDPREPEGS